MSRSSESGFTLLELIVTLAIIALVVGLVAPRMGGALAPVELESETRKVAALLRHARSQALLRNRDSEVRLSTEPPGLSLDVHDVLYQPPGHIALELRGGRVDATEVAIGAVPAIRFYAVGGSSGGQISLSLDDGRRENIDVDWLSGRVRIAADPADE